MVERPTGFPALRDVTDDIISADLRLPEHVTILAPGPNGKGNYHKINPDSYVLAVNYGVTIPVHIDGWLVGDWWGVQKEWWPRADQGFHGRRFFSVGLAERCAVWNEHDLAFQLTKEREIVKKYKRRLRTMAHDQFSPCETSVGIAIDLCGRTGVKRVDLIGVDMVGTAYYDGTESTCESCDRADGVWLFKDLIMEVIGYQVEKYGVEFRTLSETALEIKLG